MTTIQAYLDKLKPNVVVRGPLFPEPVQMITTIPLGDSLKLIATGTRSNQTHQPILSLEQLATLEFSPETEPFDGDARKFQLGIEGLAYEYDPHGLTLLTFMNLNIGESRPNREISLLLESVPVK